MTFPSNRMDFEHTCDDVANMRKLIAKLPRKTHRVLDLLIAGHSNKIIAWHLGMPETTVKSHMSTVFRTLGCKNRTHASLIAFCIVHDLPAQLAILTKNRDLDRCEYFSTIQVDWICNVDYADNSA